MLNTETLVQLGAPHLAELLMGYAEADPALARSLRLVVAEMGSGKNLGRYAASCIACWP